MNTPEPSPKDDILPTSEFSTGSGHSFRWLILGVLFLLAGLGTGYLLWGNTPPAAVNVPAQESLWQAMQESDAVWGPENAPITIVEFSDFECAYCRSWQATVWPELIKAYPGRMRFIYRDFPLEQIHPNALPAAEAAECAGEQGKYWEYHDKLFSGELGESYYEKYASDLGLDMSQFTTCLSSEKYKSEVMADLADGQLIGITGTPTFIINGTRIVGAQPLESFKQVIDQFLSN